MGRRWHELEHWEQELLFAVYGHAVDEHDENCNSDRSCRCFDESSNPVIKFGRDRS